MEPGRPEARRAPPATRGSLRERVAKPVFILGINRTPEPPCCTGCSPRAPDSWAPLPRRDRDPPGPASSGRPAGHAACRYAEDLLRATGIAEAMRGIRTVDTRKPEEEFAFLASPSPPGRSHAAVRRVPGCSPEWGSSAAMPASPTGYTLARRCGTSAGSAATRLGDQPRAMAAEDAIPPRRASWPWRRAYPDAVFIQTHRSLGRIPPVLAPALARVGPGSLSAHPLGGHRARRSWERSSYGVHRARCWKGVARLRGADRTVTVASSTSATSTWSPDPVEAAEGDSTGTLAGRSTSRPGRGWSAGIAGQGRAAPGAAAAPSTRAAQAYGLTTKRRSRATFGGYAEFKPGRTRSGCGGVSGYRG